MVLNSISQFFRNLFGLENSQVSSTGGITVWMPRFINDVEDNTRLLLRTANRLEAATRRIKERERRKREAENAVRGFISAGRRTTLFTAFEGFIR